MPGKPGPRRAGRPREPIAREALLAAARRVFAEDGYDAASTQRIAELAGLRKASLLHRFGTKQALYLEVMAGVTEALSRLLADARLGEDSFLERLDRLGTLIVSYLGRDRFAAKLLVRDAVDRGPFYRSETGRAALRLGLEAATAFLQAGIDAGAFVAADARQLALSIAALHLHYFATSDVSADIIGDDVFSEPALARRAEAVLDQVRRLCGAPPR